MQVHLAQFNTATLRRPLDHPESASYVALLDETNARAEASPGFVWRHGIDSRDSSTQVYDDPLTLVNASVWESLAALRDYAYKGFHRDVFRRRGEWFVASEAVMWWVPAGTIPTLEECKARLDFLLRHAPSPYAFETGQKFPTLAVVARPLGHPDVAPMLAQLDRELIASTPAGGSNFITIAPEHVAEGNGAFFIAYLDDAPVACGAYRRIEGVPGAAEVKRMWADPAHRGNKLGAAVLATIETAARADGFEELRLETGEHLTAAIGLYTRFGFAPCENWGEYAGVPLSHCMSKRLD